MYPQEQIGFVNWDEARRYDNSLHFECMKKPLVVMEEVPSQKFEPAQDHTLNLDCKLLGDLSKYPYT
jgi:hypothetical protein